MTDGLTGRPSGSAFSREDAMKSVAMFAGYKGLYLGAYRAMQHFGVDEAVQGFVRRNELDAAAEFAVMNPELVIPFLA